MKRHQTSFRIENYLDAPATKRALNERLFTAIASEYPWVTVGLSLGRDALWKRRLVEALPSVETPVCVDLACGTGDVARLLARRFPEGTVIGLDLTKAMLEGATDLTREKNVRYEAADMMNTSLPAESADIVTGSYALRNAPDLEGAIAEIARILRVGGYAGFLEFTRWPGRLSGRAELWLLRVWGGLWGMLLHRNAEIYGYIAESLRRFPTMTELTDLFQAQGLRRIKTIPCLFGITSILIVRKGSSA
ncbi:MAG TPA: class I SAM-dependent methyltransferase [Phycisphaerae bacterium]|nr:class I SAM-dependent methyltransferase [Phycisphaerae bacterium]